MPLLPNAAEEFSSELVFSCRFVVHNPLRRTENGYAQLTEDTGNIPVTTIGPASRGTNTINAPDGMFTIYILELDL
jgi:hypothetical protein